MKGRLMRKRIRAVSGFVPWTLDREGGKRTEQPLTPGQSSGGWAARLVAKDFRTARANHFSHAQPSRAKGGMTEKVQHQLEIFIQNDHAAWRA